MPEWFASMPRLELAEPWWLLLLPVLVFAAWLKKLQEQQGKGSAILFPGLERFRVSGGEVHRLLRVLPQWLRWGALVLTVVALAGPRLLFRQSEAESRGIDVILALDVSESMLQKDVSGKSRLDAAREVARHFVLRRSSDRIGLVVFRGKAYTQCPLTLDHEVLAMLIDHLSPRVIQDDGTAIGTAILVAVNRLKASESLHKEVILVTDGENNAGEVAPATAASLAAQSGIRIYVINAGGITIAEDRLALSAESGGHTVQDEESLQSIARTTGGICFRAEDQAGLEKSISKIDRYEKSHRAGHSEEHRSGLFFPLLLLLVILLMFDVVLSNTRLLRIP